MKKNSKSLSPQTGKPKKQTVFRYAMADEPVPEGWEVRWLSGWNRWQGRVMWIRKDDERQE